jgi:2-amino-4-hydroxy-6-hydroxymethyldihydropteridine diphosphokinase
MTAWVCLGSNLDNPVQQLQCALKYLQEKCYVKILRQSNVMISKPYGYPDQPDFANQLIEIETPLSAEELLIFLQNTEQYLGRKPTFRWGPRVIDLDIIFYGDAVIKTKDLSIPHPGIANREYLLQLLYEVIPDYQHPETKQTIRTIYNQYLNKGEKQ